MTGSAAPDPIRIGKPYALEPLWRHILGRQLRMLRLDRGEKLADTAARAGISPQYLSEIERGLKEPSSEMIAAIAGALGVTLLNLTEQLANDLRGLSGVSGARHVESRHELASSREIAFPRGSIEVSSLPAREVLAFAA
ncbi:MAG: family transcriptional regulator [Subtercola sp.]|nr:family transcriptional regulator [Subtercola sp.]